MTHQDNLAAVRAACAEVNPKIGRVIRQKPLILCDECVNGMTYDDNGDGVDSCWNCGGTGEAKNPHAGEKKVINPRLHHRIHGLQRDVTLPDVLLALGSGYGYFDGEILRLSWVDGVEYNGSAVAKWEPRLPLSGQTEETVAYLANLLK